MTYLFLYRHQIQLFIIKLIFIASGYTNACKLQNIPVVYAKLVLVPHPLFPPIIGLFEKFNYLLIRLRVTYLLIGLISQ